MSVSLTLALKLSRLLLRAKVGFIFNGFQKDSLSI